MPQTRAGASRRPQRAVRRPRIQRVSRPYAGACEEKEGEQAAAPGKNAKVDFYALLILHHHDVYTVSHRYAY